MNKNDMIPPKLAQWFMQVILPAHVKDDICGDLNEEFHQCINSDKDNAMANRWYWKQTITTCARYLFTQQRLLSALIIMITLGLFCTLYIAVTLLSYGTKETFNADFWYNGAVHSLFFEADFWRYTADGIFNDLPIGHLTDLNAAIWSIITLSLLLILNKKIRLSATVYSLAAIALMLCPYLYGVVIFKTTVLDNTEVGPLIATMWLTIMYLVIPIAFLILKKLNSNRTANLGSS